MSRDWLLMQDSFLRGTKSKCADVVESTRHVTTLSNHIPETIQFTDIPLLLSVLDPNLKFFFFFFFFCPMYSSMAIEKKYIGV